MWGAVRREGAGEDGCDREKGGVRREEGGGRRGGKRAARDVGGGGEVLS